jgi:hypothetical protein
MEDDIDFWRNGRQTQFFEKWKTTRKFQMEDTLNSFQIESDLNIFQIEDNLNNLFTITISTKNIQSFFSPEIQIYSDQFPKTFGLLLLGKAQTQTNHLIGQYKQEGGIKSILPFVISLPHFKQKIQNLFGLELVCHICIPAGFKFLSTSK